MKTSVYKATARFNMVGQKICSDLSIQDESISKGLAARLVKYAQNRLAESGFEFASSWDVEVYTTDAEDLPSNRSYTVSFRNTKGGCIEVSGLVTKRGWPFLDHGFFISDR